MSFSPRRAVVIHTKGLGQRSLGSKVRVETVGRTDGRTEPIALPRTNEVGEKWSFCAGRRCRWFMDSRAKSSRMKRRDAIRNIRYYYANVINGASTWAGKKIKI